MSRQYQVYIESTVLQQIRTRKTVQRFTIFAMSATL